MNGPVKFSWDAAPLTLEAPVGTRARFSAVWLRDQCHDGHGWSDAQRLVDIFDLPEAPRIASVSRHGDLLEIRWVEEENPASLAIGWLESIAWPAPHAAHRLWAADGAASLLWAEYASVLADRSARAEWLRALLARRHRISSRGSAG